MPGIPALAQEDMRMGLGGRRHHGAGLTALPTTLLDRSETGGTEPAAVDP